MALHAATRVQRLAGAASFSAWMPRESMAYKRLRVDGLPRLLVVYGDADDVVPQDWLKRCAAQVEREAMVYGNDISIQVIGGMTPSGHEAPWMHSSSGSTRRPRAR